VGRKVVIVNGNRLVCAVKKAVLKIERADGKKMKFEDYNAEPKVVMEAVRIAASMIV
jgi:hypothetical protein